MPQEKFYNSHRTETEPNQNPDLSVSWGADQDPLISGQLELTDRACVNRLIKTLRRVRNQQFGRDQ